MKQKKDRSTKITPFPSGKSHNPVEVLGAKAFGIIFENGHTHRCAGYKHIEMDINRCLDLINEIEQNSDVPDVFKRTATTVLAIIYGKIFASANAVYFGVTFTRPTQPL